MSLTVTISGNGQDIVFFHGWGMNSEVWQETALELSKSYRVHLIDLPGFGLNKKSDCNFELDKLADCVLSSVPNNAIIVGWSMGGLLALHIAINYKHKISRLVLVACNAQFSATDNWTTAMPPELLNAFSKSLSDNYRQTLQRFLMLQARGGENSKQTIQALKSRLFEYGEPDQKALVGGLKLLQNVSFVSQLPSLELPTLLLFGKLDSIVPIAAAEQMKKNMPNARMHLFLKAAHAPFLSHFEEFISELKKFIHE